MTEEHFRALRKIAEFNGLPSKNAATNTPEHWEGVVNAMKNIAKEALVDKPYKKAIDNSKK